MRPCRALLLPLLLPLHCVACACAGPARAPGPAPRGGVTPMDLIPAGSAIVGCDRTEPMCPEFAAPRGSRDVPAFELDRFEVTASDYAACVRAGACVGDAADGPEPVGVSHIELARAYCRFRGKRLPTALEWEKAARGTDGRPFPWGAAPPDCARAQYSQCATTGSFDVVGNEIDPVGSHPTGAGPYGTQDLAGNIGEWTECAGLGGTTCLGIIRGVEHNGADALRGYAGDAVQEGAILDFLHVGFRCARDAGPGSSQ